MRKALTGSAALGNRSRRSLAKSGHWFQTNQDACQHVVNEAFNELSAVNNLVRGIPVLQYSSIPVRYSSMPAWSLPRSSDHVRTSRYRPPGRILACAALVVG